MNYRPIWLFGQLGYPETTPSVGHSSVNTDEIHLRGRTCAQYRVLGHPLRPRIGWLWSSGTPEESPEEPHSSIASDCAEESGR
jgi:hypothetical protein